MNKKTTVIATAAPVGRGGLFKKPNTTRADDGPSDSMNEGMFWMSCTGFTFE
jgi:hypothetical protein